MAAATAGHSPLVASALQRLNQQISTVGNRMLREQTEDALFNPATCVMHRANLTEAAKQAILAQLLQAGLYSPADAAGIQGWRGSRPYSRRCATRAHRARICRSGFGVAPGSSFGGHQSYPGGLPIHESFNTSSALAFGENYELSYGTLGADHLPHVAPLPPFARRRRRRPAICRSTMTSWWPPRCGTTGPRRWCSSGMRTAPNSPSSISVVRGQTDDYGAAGDSRTGGHHIISLAESMARNLPAAFIDVQASAHSAPTLGDEFKVVNWLRAAAIIAQVDPVARGYLGDGCSGGICGCRRCTARTRSG